MVEEDHNNYEGTPEVTLTGEAEDYISLEEAQALVLSYVRRNRDFYRGLAPGRTWSGGCWERMSEPLSDDQYQVHAMVEFLDTEPDRARARPVLDNLGAALAAGSVVPLDPEAPPPSPDTHTPLNYAPAPEHPLRGFFDDATIEGFLDRLLADQEEDGGWPIDWPAPGMTAANEWRAVRTLEALEVLLAYGRL